MKGIKTDDEPWLSKHALKVLVGLLFVALAISGGAIWAYYSRFGGLPSSEDATVAASAWGQLGDFFGGTLNPIFGLLSVLALFTTIVYQRSELKLSREELKLSRTELQRSAEALNAQNVSIDQQRFEQTFFSWLGNYRELLASVEIIVDDDEERRGRRALFYWWSHRLSEKGISRVINRLADRQPAYESLVGVADSGDLSMFHKLSEVDRQRFVVTVMAEWALLYQHSEYQLDSLFRTLFRLLQWIDSQDSAYLSNSQKWLYVSIVRSQLSWIELVFLFYNGHTQRGVKFRVLADKYALFDNLNFASDTVLQMLKECPLESGSYSPSAYNSTSARLALSLPETTEETLALAAQKGR